MLSRHVIRKEIGIVYDIELLHMFIYNLICQLIGPMNMLIVRNVI